MTATTRLPLWVLVTLTMRIVRWAAEKSTSGLDEERLLAVSVLNALDNSKPTMLQADDQGILDAVLEALLADVTGVVEGYSGGSSTSEVEAADDG